MVRTDIETAIEAFKSKSGPNERYASFDYCYNYFSSTENITKDIEKSCLMLGFYLASWGMFRGSSFLLQRSVKGFDTTVRYISGLEKSVWNIDVDSYTDENMQMITDIYENIKGCLIDNGNADLVLITKILLGVFGFVPAFDRYFGNTFRDVSGGRCGFRRVNKNSLTVIKKFYEANRETIDRLSSHTFTTDFLTGLKRLKITQKQKLLICMASLWALRHQDIKVTTERSLVVGYFYEN
ncbi:MAG TPA: hypothetical protein VK468_02340 [Pyrinomonadaceae bacterium]|nr:hypothetical protein [Pyrinomonadaceae bacterium]